MRNCFSRVFWWCASYDTKRFFLRINKRWNSFSAYFPITVYRWLLSGIEVTKANKESNNSYVMGDGRGRGGRNRFGFSDQSDASARLVARRRICWRGIPDRARSGSRRHDSSTTRSRVPRSCSSSAPRVRGKAITGKPLEGHIMT